MEFKGIAYQQRFLVVMPYEVLKDLNRVRTRLPEMASRPQTQSPKPIPETPDGSTQSDVACCGRSAPYSLRIRAASSSSLRGQFRFLKRYSEGWVWGLGPTSGLGFRVYLEIGLRAWGLFV